MSFNFRRIFCVVLAILLQSCVLKAPSSSSARESGDQFGEEPRRSLTLDQRRLALGAQYMDQEDKLLFRVLNTAVGFLFAIGVYTIAFVPPNVSPVPPPPGTAQPAAVQIVDQEGDPQRVEIIERDENVRDFKVADDNSVNHMRSILHNLQGNTANGRWKFLLVPVAFASLNVMPSLRKKMFQRIYDDNDLAAEMQSDLKAIKEDRAALRTQFRNGLPPKGYRFCSMQGERDNSYKEKVLAEIKRHNLSNPKSSVFVPKVRNFDTFRIDKGYCPEGKDDEVYIAKDSIPVYLIGVARNPAGSDDEVYILGGHELRTDRELEGIRLLMNLNEDGLKTAQTHTLFQMSGMVAKDQDKVAEVGLDAFVAALHILTTRDRHFSTRPKL